ncbi:uncharacterized protein LOC111029283 [Myzus persicae]|uniref:uncharacterized protein LOC111029283 n=2 Tax=Myzus persicae TaxID=13164 RepID=UPI000B935C9D|nr:uncharacterized protein LOC111029283 [Myzus persicae]
MAGGEQETERETRAKSLALIKRTTVVSNIRAIHAMALCVKNEPDLVPQFLVAVTDLDSLWNQFKLEDESVLNSLVKLNEVTDYDVGLPAEVRGLITASKAMTDQVTQTPADNPGKSYSRLPEIPLPTYDGDLRDWITFRDSFTTLLNKWPNLSDIDKMYYLVGSLKGDAAEAVRGIPLSGDNYRLVWSTLTDRFNRPRLVATSLVDNLLNATNMSQESYQDLNQFICTFNRNIALLDALKIHDLGSFMLFSIAFRCLPIVTRRLFEASSSTDYPTANQLIDFLRSRVAVLEVAGDSHKSTPSAAASSKFGKPTGQSRTGGERSGKPQGYRPTSLVTAKSGSVCPCCSESHNLAACTKFKSWPVDERSRWTREHKLCYVCFSADHWAPRCRSKINSSECSRRHHYLLHVPAGERHDKPETPSPVSAPASCCASVQRPSPQQSPAVMLGTAIVHVRDRSGSWQTMRALVDCASQISAITAACADRLGLKRSRWTAPISGLSGVAVNNVQGRVECTVHPRFASEPALAVHAWVLPTITNELPTKTLAADIKDRYSNLALADPSFYVSSPIDLLLGSDVFSSIMDGRKISVDDALPSAFSSVFGWILIGPVSGDETGPRQSLPVSLTVSIEGLMERFWHVEEPEVAPETFTDNGRCEQIFVDETIRLSTGRFSVPLPFRVPSSDELFGARASRDVAVRRFESLERKLSADPLLKSLYTQFMSEYISLEHKSVATSPGCYFIPHHAVYRPEVDINKIRVVFDASAKCGRGPSLNDCLFPGPKLQQDIVDILTRFRVHKYVFTTDICKMYRQVLILPKYRKFQHILWRATPHDKLLEYELNTVTYGVNCAPYLALRVLQSITSDDCTESEWVRNALTRQTYVDDICDGADTIAEVLKLQSDLICVLNRSGLELKKWSSNTTSVLDAVPAANRVHAPTPFETVDGQGTKVLGLEWHPDGDYLRCALNLEQSPVYTKRGILSLVARIFDPLGVFGPAVFLAKFIMQRTWLRGLTWDEPLSPDIHDELAAFVADLPSLMSIRVPRHFNSRRNAPCYLLGFCDASQRGYAAVVYLRMVEVPVGDSVFLVGTKTKLASTKSMTIPRLELNAALLLARWLNRIRGILAAQLNIVDIRAWSDSMIVLSWLKVPHESVKVYVSNRVHKIRTLLPDCRWQHIESVNNPADCASRGVMPAVLSQLNLYWHGPQIAYDDPSAWDDSRPSLPLCELPELRFASCAALVADVPNEWFTRFSNYDRMLREVAYMRRFIALCRRKIGRMDGPIYLRKCDLDSAAQLLIVESQRVHFPSLLGELSRGTRVSSRPLARLSPFIDPDGVIRVGGRLRHSLIAYDCKHPVLLSKSSHFALLLCRRWHLLTCHAGPRALTALISRQFWVVSLRSLLHKILTNCTICVRLDARPLQPLMADLPRSRVRPRRPFESVGVDYAGPLQMRELQLRKSRVFKIYIAVFVCFSTKAVHLEVVSDLSTDAFLAAFDRFVARRGLPSDVFSDCGTNFVGADRQLRSLIHSAEGQAAIGNARATYCDWHFNPPSAPHFGGLWEAAVRSTKRLLVRVIGNHIFTYEEFSTILVRVEAVLNSRPLTPASTDPHDLDCLTPGHFLIGQPLLAVPPRSDPASVRDMSNRWKLLDQCHQAFWRRWSTEYLTTLQERSKWTTDTPNLSVNDMVIIIDNQSPPLSWRLGRVIQLLPGTDGRVRVARVLTQAGEIVRPVVKLVLLPTE